MTTAADAISKLETNTTLRRRVLIVAVILAAAGLLLLIGRCAGRQRNAPAIAALVAKRDTIQDTIQVVERRLVVDTQRVRIATTAATVARQAFDSTEHAVLAVADTATMLPASMVVPAMHVCSAALSKDSIEHVADAQALADMTIDRDAQRDRAAADECQLALTKPPRFGFRTGATVGAAVVALVVHLLR